MTTAIILVRHGETAWNRRQVFRGTYDIELNDNGRQQASLLTKVLSRYQIDAAYSSPLCRAVQTAEIALAGTGVQIATDKRLTDFCYGDWQGLEETEVKRRWPAELAGWLDRPQSLRVPGGNTLTEVYNAAFEAMEQLAAKHDGQTIAIFAHRVVNKLLVLAALGLPLEQFAFIRQDNCCIDEFHRTEKGYIIVSLNDTAHLRTDSVDVLAADF